MPILSKNLNLAISYTYMIWSPLIVIMSDSSSEEAPVRQTRRARRGRRNALEEKPYKCLRGCNKAYASISARRYHHQSFHNKIRFECPWILCQKQYTTERQRDIHVKAKHTPTENLRNILDFYNLSLMF